MLEVTVNMSVVGSHVMYICNLTIGMIDIPYDHWYTDNYEGDNILSVWCD